MSIETWKREFYPIDAKSEMSEKEAILHSIKKWEGLTKENLNKHMLDADVDCGWLSDEFGEAFFDIDSSNCALCAKFIQHGCQDCPLYKKQGFVCGKGDKTDGYLAWSQDADPSLMLENLKSLCSAKMMKHEIEIPDLPEGWKAVAYRVPSKIKDEYTLSDDWDIVPAKGIKFPVLIIEKIRPLSRVILEETEEERSVSFGDWYGENGNIIARWSDINYGSNRTFTIWRAVKEGE